MPHSNNLHSHTFTVGNADVYCYIDSDGVRHCNAHRDADALCNSPNVNTYTYRYKGGAVTYRYGFGVIDLDLGIRDTDA